MEKRKNKAWHSKLSCSSWNKCCPELYWPKWRDYTVPVSFLWYRGKKAVEIFELISVLEKHVRIFDIISIYKDNQYIFLHSFPILWPGLEEYTMLTFRVLVPSHYLHIWKSYLARGEESFKTVKPFGEFPKYNPGSSITNIHKQGAAWVPWTAHNFCKVWHLTCKVVLKFRHLNLRLQSSKSLISSRGVNIDKVPVTILSLLRYRFWKYSK